jgi:hypothetical protein
MSIDGIGRPPRPPNGVGFSGGPAPTGDKDTFQVERSGEAKAVSPSGPLARLERGEISVDQYLDARVEEAVEPLVKRLAPETLDFVRKSLRIELSTDPVLIELVKRATAAVPSSTDP